MIYVVPKNSYPKLIRATLTSRLWALLLLVCMMMLMWAWDNL